MSMNIPDEAVEAMSKTYFEGTGVTPNDSWMRTLLTAAAPFIAARWIVTTVEELATLPISTVILDLEELPLYKDDSDRIHVWCFGDNVVEPMLPASVIYVPKPLLVTKGNPSNDPAA